ncbi:TIGR04255 family protein [Oscillospiraceae bacterium OttesenSCG-928-G22]|nr:TIGR04255 family protein [Oscillospiraceae bacterium OttesenSCG-928-G22]
MKRVIYKNTPLIEVILQVQFPTNLEINATDPVEFQNAIKSSYPNYQLGLENEQEIFFQVDKDGVAPTFAPRQQHKNHAFISENGSYKINLGSNFLSISTLSYSRWEDFIDNFRIPFDNLIKIYLPPYLNRVGLRYVDAFSKEKLSLQDKRWDELIKPQFLGLMSSLDEQYVEACNTTVEYTHAAGKRTRINSGLGFIGTTEKVFVIDSDFFTIENIKPEDFFTIANDLHSNANKILQSAITEELHLAMGPSEL